MTLSSETPHGDSRQREFERLTEKAKDALGSIEFIKKLPKPPKRRKIVFPYGNDGSPPSSGNAWI